MSYPTSSIQRFSSRAGRLSHVHQFEDGRPEISRVRGAAALARSMAALLYGVRPLDPVAFVTAAVVLGIVALTAASVPAMQAARVDPAIALREE